MKVFIGCASLDNIDKKYIDLAHNVSKHLADNGYDLVFGACNKSMMGECYNTFINCDRTVTSCIPKIYIDDLNELKESEHQVYDDTITRFKGLYDLCDLIVILPGGIGTLSELMASIEESKNLNDYKKKIVLFNYEGYYDGIINWLNDKKQEGFITKDIKELVAIVNDEDSFYKEVGGIK